MNELIRLPAATVLIFALVIVWRLQHLQSETPPANTWIAYLLVAVSLVCLLVSCTEVKSSLSEGTQDEQDEDVRQLP